MQAPQSMHLAASMTAMSSQVMAPSGHTSTQAPQPTHSDSLTVTILITSSSTADTLGLFDCYHLDNLIIEDGKTL